MEGGFGSLQLKNSVGGWMKHVSLFLIVVFGISAFGQELTEREKKVLEFLERLFAAPDRIEAATLIRSYAKERARGKKEGMHTDEELRAAIAELNAHLPLFADQKYGNKDGKGKEAETRLMGQALKHNPGMEVLLDLTGS